MTTSFIERVKASTDAFTGLVAVANGAVQTVAGDLLGRAWVRAFGDTPHDTPDNTNAAGLANNPVKVGGFAVATGTVPAAVSAAGDRVNAAYSLAGAQHGLTSPNPITDATTYAFAVQRPTAGDAAGRIVVKATPGRLRRLVVVNNDPTNTLYLQLHDTAAVGTIATGTLQYPGLPVPAGGGVGEWDFDDADLSFPTGISAALSTTQLTYTAAAVTGQFAGQYA